MAYNKFNRLKKIEAVQQVTRYWQKIGLSNKLIYERYIRERFFISKRTFEEYMKVDVLHEMEQLNKKNK